MKTLPRFLQVSTVPSDASPWWVALLIHGLTIRFLSKEKPRRCRLVATEASDLSFAGQNLCAIGARHHLKTKRGIAANGLTQKNALRCRWHSRCDPPDDGESLQRANLPYQTKAWSSNLPRFRCRQTALSLIDSADTRDARKLVSLLQAREDCGFSIVRKMPSDLAFAANI